MVNCIGHIFLKKEETLQRFKNYLENEEIEKRINKELEKKNILNEENSLKYKKIS